MARKTIMESVILLFIILIAGNAFADYNPVLGLYMTDKGVTTPKEDQIFGWEEMPYAFVQFDAAYLNTGKPLRVRWKWKYKNLPDVFIETARTTITEYSGDQISLWQGLEEWDSKKREGEWSVRINWINPGGESGHHYTHFNVASSETPPVVPEPLSALLFVAGAMPLAVKYMNRKKAAA